MKRYYIEIYYETGDSFSHHDETSDLKLEWDDLDIAKDNLKRIKEHYAWYEKKNDYRFMNGKDNPQIEKPDCADKKYEFVIHLSTDDGKDCRISAYWCGYFESLYSAEIKEHDNPDLVFVTEQGKYKRD